MNIHETITCYYILTYTILHTYGSILLKCVASVQKTSMIKLINGEFRLYIV